MTRHHFLVLVILLTGTSSADVLVDDFEGASPQNKLGWSWYYFSDVKDGGNSKILNAQQLSNGSYSPFKPDTGGCESERCAKVEFMMGNIKPRKSADVYMANFIGIGTDIAQPGRFVDIRPANGIRFRARSNDSLAILFELITSTIYDFAYYRTYFIIDSTWRQYTVKFYDSTEFKIPEYCINPLDPDRYPLDLFKVQKVNWQAIELGVCLELPEKIAEKASSCFQDSGSFYIDDVCFIGIDSLPGAAQSTSVNFKRCMHPALSTSFPSASYDLLGRVILPYGKIDLLPGVYVWQRKSGRTDNILIDKTR